MLQNGRTELHNLWNCALESSMLETMGFQQMALFSLSDYPRSGKQLWVWNTGLGEGFQSQRYSWKTYIQWFLIFKNQSVGKPSTHESELVKSAQSWSLLLSQKGCCGFAFFLLQDGDVYSQTLIGISQLHIDRQVLRSSDVEYYRGGQEIQSIMNEKHKILYQYFIYLEFMLLQN